MNANEAYANLAAHGRTSADLASSVSLLSWDQQVMLPPAAHPGRAGQIGAMTAILHRRATDPHIGEWLAACEGSTLTADPLTPEAANIREWRRDFDLAVKIPEGLAVALARAASAGQRAWELARKDDAFAAFAPHLATLLDLSRQKAEALGYAGEPYDALLDGFEPGETVATIAPILAELRDETTALLDAVKGAVPPAPLPAEPYPQADQQAFLARVTALIGLPAAASRLDVSAHPFSTLIGPGDARITVRYDEADFTKALFGAVHETGHALYSLGHASDDRYGTPMGEFVSLGVHESQSRLWENQVARSLPFWEHVLPLAARHFPTLAGLAPSDVFRAVGAIAPGLIRVDADETTYNPHIVLRFELELALLRGDLLVADLPGAWNEKSRAILGLTPPNDAAGCLQDVHWSMGAFGYFPTYSLGNIYAACLFEAAETAIPDLAGRMAAGNFAPLLKWLGQNIHAKGRLLRPRDLIAAATGKAPTAGPLLRHLKAKAAAIYGV
ncbi:Carboxypeptidase Taq [Solidesulfovibrio carbinoliphilus subsp. oakridgensis]|uniref:Metal-dependent carboxypeptidase n=1 Tax=Solidesulfovibrio carbinoliphilus subsp. oakridgensis TaxID=694327 RepID=G7QDX5_9BACT|nr:carboxypeptidase M32 [Solidesulfovibrio carbinoliphilus]EHJ46631.1 Carboxypeptidase Taq [Solidesulfovibrio carbinoliphilus subsp. oakridgensis]